MILMTLSKVFMKQIFLNNVIIEIVNNNLIITVKENPIIQEVVIEGITKESLKDSNIRHH